MKLTLNEITSSCSGRLINEEYEGAIKGISIDSRTIAEGEFFVPIKGEKYDGHDYIVNAYENGAVGTLTHNPEYLDKSYRNVIMVEDTLKAFNDIAFYYRRKFNIPFVAITGSTGKTTTKDMVANVLSQKYNVLKNTGSYNNNIGLPLTIFRLKDEHEIAVVEVGMNNLREIAYLSKIVEPHIGVITNIGLSHIERLGSVENIIKAKSELLEGLDKEGVVFINEDDSNLLKIKENYPRIKFKTFGINHGNIRANKINTISHNRVAFEVEYNNITNDFHLNIPGLHNVYNALAAISLGLEFNLTTDEIKTGLSKFTTSEMRLEIIDGINGITIINDSYNACPDSMRAAIDVLHEFKIRKKGRTIAVLGDMLEMGKWGIPSHRELGKYLGDKKIDGLITVGNKAKHIAISGKESGIDEKMIFIFNSNKEAINKLKDICNENDIILIKGSRGMKMEEIAHSLINGR